MGECRNIYLNACAEIAAAFADHGFRYLKSQQAMVKRELELTFRVSFQSDFRNWLVDHPIEAFGPGTDDSNVFPTVEQIERENSIYGSVDIRVRLRVDSKRMQEWRVSLPHPLRTHDGIAGGYLGDFVGDGRQWLIADLANPNARPGRIRTIIDLITSAALPYFERFRDPQSVIAGLIDGSDPGLSHELAMEYAAFHGGKEKSMAVLGRYLRDAPDYFLGGLQGVASKVPAKWASGTEYLRWDV
jgi:hypothetical protein